MATDPSTPTPIDAFIAQFSPDIQAILLQIRAVIREVAPEAQETIGYGIPTFTLHGNLVHFSAFKKHIGFYPASSGIERFKDELAVYAGAKGSVQFPLDQPIPYGLIRRITAFRVEENLAKARAKQSRKNNEQKIGQRKETPPPNAKKE